MRGRWMVGVLMLGLGSLVSAGDTLSIIPSPASALVGEEVRFRFSPAVKREGVVFVYCDRNPKHKQRQG